MSQIFAIVLAAGRGKRMMSRIPKVAYKLHKKTLLQWTIDSLLQAQIDNIMVVISRKKILKNILETHYPKKNIKFCYQDKQLGTAHAVMCGLKAWHKPQDDDSILIAYGDTPAIKSETYKKLVQFHMQEENVITIIAFYAKNPFGYGRVIVNENLEFLAIREEKDCTPLEKEIHLCHSGLMCVNFSVLSQILPKVQNTNKASEFYLTDIIQIAKSHGHKIGFIASDREDEFRGVNTLEQLSALETSLCAV